MTRTATGARTSSTKDQCGSVVGAKTQLGARKQLASGKNHAGMLIRDWSISDITMITYAHE